MLSIFTKAASWVFDTVLSAPSRVIGFNWPSRVIGFIFNVIFQTHSDFFNTYSTIFSLVMKACSGYEFDKIFGILALSLYFHSIHLF